MRVIKKGSDALCGQIGASISGLTFIVPVVHRDLLEAS